MMSKKVFLGVGHGGSDPGAKSYLVEKDVNLKMALACRDYLQACGVTVKMSRTKDEADPLTDEIKECNAYNPDLAMDIHNNAGGGEGFEVYYYSGGGKSKELAKNCEAQIKLIGQKSRGIKTRLNKDGKTDYYGFIRETKAPAVICEGAFVDNKNDAAKIDTDAECRKFGEAYAKAILATLGLPLSKPAEPVTSSKYYYVQVGAYTDRKNAENMVTKLKNAGFDAIIKE